MGNNILRQHMLRYEADLQQHLKNDVLRQHMKPYEAELRRGQQNVLPTLNMPPFEHFADGQYRVINSSALKVANDQSFLILLLSLPYGARQMIKKDNDNFIDAKSVEAACRRYKNSEILKALKEIVSVSDGRIVVFNATAKSYKRLDNAPKVFLAPTRDNDFQLLMNKYEKEAPRTPQEIQQYAQQVINIWGIKDEISVRGNFGAVLRPSYAQESYPGGEVSTTNEFEVYVNPVKTTYEEKVKFIGHELFGHLYYFLILGKDPRHGGETGVLADYPELETFTTNMEREAERNFQYLEY